MVPSKKSWFHIKNWVYILPIVYVAHLLSVAIPLLGVFRTIENVGIEKCRKLIGPEDFKNCEDFAFSDEIDVLYFSCDPIRNKFNKVMGINTMKQGEIDVSGSIWRVKYTEDPPVFEKLSLVDDKINVTADYHPLGLAIDTHPRTGEQTLITANLPHNRESIIELFGIRGTHLYHKKTIKSPLLYAPNSIHILTDERFRADDGTPSFFFSNDHYFSNTNYIFSAVLKKVENFCFHLSNVRFYNARVDNVEESVAGLAFANGVSGTDDVLFVAETYKRSVKKYNIVPIMAPNPHVRLNFVQEQKFEMGVDNIHYDSKKNKVVVAGHPQVSQLLKFVRGRLNRGSALPPSQIDSWDLNDKKVDTLFKDDGSFFGTSSTGSIDANDKLIVSGLYEKGFLVCDQ
ncbi:hypothetical protein K501DRAFT_262804, partial [Backusella circina FSU 941]